MNDSIRRQDVVSEINVWIQSATDNETDMAIKEFLSFFKERIDTLPSTDRPTGKWILQDTSYWRATYAGDVPVNRVNLKCSHCGWRNFDKKYYNYCPNCGAQMDEKEQEHG